MMGYIVVYRKGNQYRSPRTDTQVRGISPDELWLFGRPMTEADYAMQAAIAPVVLFLAPGMIHILGEGNRIIGVKSE